MDNSHYDLSCYGRSEEVDNAVLVIVRTKDQTETEGDEVPTKRQKTSEEVEIPVIKELLMFQSPVFKTMFTSAFKEADTCRVELPRKHIESVLHMLDFMYPTRTLEMDDNRATAILPLAHEYQIEKLKTLCVDELKKFAKPRLEYVSLAVRFDIACLLKAAIDSCASKLQLDEMDRQLLDLKNKEIDDSMILKILRRKTIMARDFVAGTLNRDLSSIGCIRYSYGNQCDFSCSGLETRNKPRVEAQELINKINTHCPKF